MHQVSTNLRKEAGDCCCVCSGFAVLTCVCPGRLGEMLEYEEEVSASSNKKWVAEGC